MIVKGMIVYLPSVRAYHVLIFQRACPRPEKLSERFFSVHTYIGMVLKSKINNE